MKANVFLKGLIMAIVGFIASYISQTTTGIDWAYLGISTGAFTIMYLGKNYLFPSVSIMGVLDLRDALSGLFIAISMAISGYLASWIVGTSVDWQLLGTSVLSATGAYILKTILSITNPPKNVT